MVRNQRATESFIVENFPVLESLPKLRSQKRLMPKPLLKIPGIATDKPKFIPFFTKNDVFSNFFECKIVVNNQNYHSSEQYLFAEKALVMDNNEFNQRIMKSKEPKYCKKLGEELSWPEGVESWRDFAQQKLKFVNISKYTQNKHLLKTLFDTFPSTLVETNEYDRFWGIGLRKTDPDVQHPEKWKGENTMGKLLTEIRNELMADPRLSLLGKPKRALESPESLQDPKRKLSV